MRTFLLVLAGLQFAAAAAFMVAAVVVGDGNPSKIAVESVASGMMFFYACAAIGGGIMTINLANHPYLLRSAQRTEPWWWEVSAEDTPQTKG